MIMGVAGGAVIPFIQGLINDQIGFTAALVVILVCLVFMGVLSLKIRNYVS